MTYKKKLLPATLLALLSTSAGAQTISNGDIVSFTYSSGSPCGAMGSGIVGATLTNPVNTCNYLVSVISTSVSSPLAVIQNVANGVAGTDAANVGQLNTLNSQFDSALTKVAASFGNSSYNPATGAFTQPSYAVGTGTYNNVGGAIAALNGQSAALGTQQNVIGTTTAANFGAGSTYNPTTGNISAPAYSVGGATYNNVGSAVGAIDTKTDTLGNSSAANIGGGAVYDSTTGKISAPTITAAGNNYTDTTSAIQALDKSAVQYDKTAAGTVDTANITFQGAADTTLHNVAAGVAAMDAANVGQLTALGSGLNTKSDSLGNSTAANIGGGAVYDSTTGKISAPTITAAGVTHTDTTSAIQALDKSAIQYDKTAFGIVDNANLTLLGTGGTVIHNVKDGVAATDAVNVEQLSSLSSKNNTSLASFASSLGGGATYDAVTGSLTQPNYTVGTGTYNNVGGAISALNGQSSALDTKSDSLGASTAANIGGGATYVNQHPKVSTYQHRKVSS